VPEVEFEIDEAPHVPASRHGAGQVDGDRGPGGYAARPRPNRPDVVRSTGRGSLVPRGFRRNMWPRGRQPTGPCRRCLRGGRARSPPRHHRGDR
jgi:hypothetical protein